MSNNLFNSVDFQKFLKDNKAFIKSKNNTSIPRSISHTFQTTDLFKSADSFSNLFNSTDAWKMAISDIQRQKSGDNEDLPSLSLNISEDDRFRSNDWKNLGNHVDVSYSPNEVFNSESDCCTKEQHTQEGPTQEDPYVDLAEETTSFPKTNWGDFFYEQLHPPAAPATDVEAEAFRIAATYQVEKKPDPSSKPKKRPQRKSQKRRKAENTDKEYVDYPSNLDVLLGRGGKSNHHKGNKRYREEISNFKSSYLALDNKDAKTDLTYFVVDYVHKYGGRFLALDKDLKRPRWYIAPDVVARRKVSQALREDDDPVKRAEKRARYLNKKMANKIVVAET